MEFDGVEFTLTDNFLDKYKRKSVAWGPLGYFVFMRTYSRPISKNRSESWWQTVRRVVEGCYLIQKRHCRLISIPWNERQAKISAQYMYDLIFTMKFLPPGRGLWAMGTEFMFKYGGTGLNNCAFVSTRDLYSEFSSPFVFLMAMSMHGVGVGFDTEGAFEKEIYLKEPRIHKGETFVIPDTREGWIDCFKRILDAYTNRDILPEKFDYSEIRPAGFPIKGFGGISPGPEPLRVLERKTRKLLDFYVKDEKSVDSTLIVDLMNVAGEAVVAGGVRRSSEIALGRYDDEDYIALKDKSTPTDKTTTARWASNNSIFADVGMDYSEIAKKSSKNGEPGFLYLENAKAYGRMGDPKDYADEQASGINPCGEQVLQSKEICCLVETFPSKHNTLEEYENTLKYAYLYAKTVTLMPTFDERTNAVMLRNRRIGLSQTGIVENINKIGFREHIRWCDKGYKTVKYWDKIYSDWMCIPKSIRVTTVKPSGTVSLLPGVTPGIHFPHSEYYIRRVRVSKNSSIPEAMKKAGYKVEPDSYEKENTVVVEFPIYEPNFSLRKDQVSLWEQLELAAQMQAYWSDNSVSATVTILPGQEGDLPRALSMYESRLKSISFLPLDPSVSYTQAPYESISREQYEQLAGKLKPYRLDVEEDDRIDEKFCDGETCVI